MDILWAGWRSDYVRNAEDLDAAGCLFCRLAGLPDQEALILERGEHAFSVLNRFPYTTGHLMVAPYRHVATPADLDEPERLDSWELIARSQRALEAAMHPAGFNLGANVGGTRVVPEDLDETWRRLRVALGVS